MSVKLRLDAAPARLVALAVGIVVTVVALLTLGGAEAANKQPSCGDTITVDTKLDSDLLDCPNNGLVIGADGVTVNLNGHVITGDGEEFSECPKGEFCDVGVLSDRYDGVTVMNGTTRGFNLGVTMAGSDGSEIVGITATKNVFFGAIFNKSNRGVIRKSTLSRNTPPDGDGLGLFRCKRMQVLHNSIEDNEGPGIHVGDSSTRVLIKKNEFTQGRAGSPDRGQPHGGPREPRGRRLRDCRQPAGQAQRDRPQPGGPVDGQHRGRGRSGQPRRGQRRDRGPRQDWDPAWDRQSLSRRRREHGHPK